jgi:hypothetical protein
MKKFLPCLILFGMFLGMPLLAEENSFTIGLHGLGGARYDNVRMCVGSPSGVPGGPIGEFYVDLRFPSGKNKTFIVNLPLFRPVYFAFAFDMLQLEPQVTLEYYLGTGGGIRPVVAWGAGAVFHYGPDYNSSPEAPGSAFFAVGPLVSGSAGLALWDGRIITGAKIFYAPLFSPDRPVGTVAGGALEVQFILDI